LKIISLTKDAAHHFTFGFIMAELVAVYGLIMENCFHHILHGNFWTEEKHIGLAMVAKTVFPAESFILFILKENNYK